MREAIAPIQNKVGALLQSPIIRNILGQVRNKVSIPFTMDISVEVSGNLEPSGWTTVASSLDGAASTGPGPVSEITGPGDTLIIEVRAPISLDTADRCFLRIRVAKES